MKRTLSENDFKDFKKYAKQCIDKFQLQNWDVYFTFKDLSEEGVWAKTHIKAMSHIATVTLSSVWNINDEIPFHKTLLDTARHEIIHILIGKLGACANCRFVSQDELTEAEEEIVIRLTKLLKDFTL